MLKLLNTKYFIRFSPICYQKKQREGSWLTYKVGLFGHIRSLTKSFAAYSQTHFTPME